ncbi:MAG: ribonuclease P protein component [Alcaligenaceae bacterium]|jgi:ribonuclease P protein component
MPSATFPAAARLHRPSEFTAALSGRRVARGAYFVLTARVNASTEQSPAGPAIARLGLIMAKRFAQHAVTRNALKRVVREAFRLRRLSLPPADYVVRLNKRINTISLSALKLEARAEANAHFLKAEQC